MGRYKLPTASADLQAVSSKFARKYSGPFRIVDRLPNGVSYVLEDPVSGAQRKVNRVHLKLYALPLETPPIVPEIPLPLRGLPPLPNVRSHTRETVQLQADLPREAEPPHLPVSEDIYQDSIEPDVPKDPVPEPNLLEQGPHQCPQENQRPLRPTLPRRALAGEPTAQYHFVSM